MIKPNKPKYHFTETAFSVNPEVCLVGSRLVQNSKTPTQLDNASIVTITVTVNGQQKKLDVFASGNPY